MLLKDLPLYRLHSGLRLEGTIPRLHTEYTVFLGVFFQDLTHAPDGDPPEMGTVPPVPLSTPPWTVPPSGAMARATSRKSNLRAAFRSRVATR